MIKSTLAFSVLNTCGSVSPRGNGERSSNSGKDGTTGVDDAEVTTRLPLLCPVRSSVLRNFLESTSPLSLNKSPSMVSLRGRQPKELSPCGSFVL